MRSVGECERGELCTIKEGTCDGAHYDKCYLQSGSENRSSVRPRVLFLHSQSLSAHALLQKLVREDTKSTAPRRDELVVV
jgi:hypothetical protein